MTATQALLVASKKSSLEAAVEKSKHMIMCREQNALQKFGNKSFETVAKFKYLRKPLINQIMFTEKLKED
jgi:hypothetical protein